MQGLGSFQVSSYGSIDEQKSIFAVVTSLTETRTPGYPHLFLLVSSPLAFIG